MPITITPPYEENDYKPILNPQPSHTRIRLDPECDIELGITIYPSYIKRLLEKKLGEKKLEFSKEDFEEYISSLEECYIGYIEDFIARDQKNGYFANMFDEIWDKTSEYLEMTKKADV